MKIVVFLHRTVKSKQNHTSIKIADVLHTLTSRSVFISVKRLHLIRISCRIKPKSTENQRFIKAKFLCRYTNTPDSIPHLEFKKCIGDVDRQRVRLSSKHQHVSHVLMLSHVVCRMLSTAVSKENRLIGNVSIR